MRLGGKVQESEATQNSCLVGPDDFRIAGDSPPAIDLEAKTGLAALHRRDGLKSAAMLGKIQHDATILFPELQVNELLRSSAYDRALVLSCRFHVQFRLNNCAGEGKRGAEDLCLLAQQARPLILSDQA